MSNNPRAPATPPPDAELDALCEELAAIKDWWRAPGRAAERALEAINRLRIAREVDVERVWQTIYYLDCEFDGHSGPLLSMALVREDGRGIHIQTDQIATDPWVVANVMPLMDADRAQARQRVPLNEVGPSLKSFMGDTAPHIVADSPVDIGRFCRALSTGSNGQWSSADYPRMTFEVVNIDCYPTQLRGAIQHNAWWDAMALRAAMTGEK